MRSVRLLVCVCLVLAGGVWVCGRQSRPAAGTDAAAAVPVAMYHSVTDAGESPGPYVISPAMFERDLQLLRARGCHTVTVTDLVAYVRDGTPLPEKPVMLTFDDGYYNNYCHAWPLLRQYGMRAVLSPVARLTEQFSESADPPNDAWSYCTGAQLREMAASGVMEIQNHSYDFHALHPRRGCLRRAGEGTDSYRALFTRDTERAQQVLAACGVPEPVCYTYPYGLRSGETDALVEQCGFAASLGCEEGIAHFGRDPRCLTAVRRYNRDGRLDSEAFWDGLLEQAEKEGQG